MTNLSGLVQPDVSEYSEILRSLDRIFGNNNVVPEWSIAKNSKDIVTRNLYCPRVDFAVDPFNITSDRTRNNDVINRF